MKILACLLLVFALEKPLWAQAPTATTQNEAAEVLEAGQYAPVKTVRISGQPGQPGLTLSSYRAAGADPIAPLVIYFDNERVRESEAAEEDLNVMTRVVDRALEEFAREQPARNKRLYTSGGRSARALYLEGFGALLMAKVNFPLLANSTNTSAAERSDKAVKGGLERPQLAVEAPAEGGPNARPDGFHPELVRKATEAMLQALKEGANIRNVRSNEFVSVGLFGPSAGSRMTITSAAMSGRLPANHPPLQKNMKCADCHNVSEAPGGGIGVVAGGPSNFGPTAPDKSAGQIFVNTTRNRSDQFEFTQSATGKGTVMTLRAAKADIDAYAAGRLSKEEFGKRVNRATYFGTGQGTPSVNSWIRTMVKMVMRPRRQPDRSSVS